MSKITVILLCGVILSSPSSAQNWTTETGKNNKAATDVIFTETMIHLHSSSSIHTWTTESEKETAATKITPTETMISQISSSAAPSATTTENKVDSTLKTAQENITSVSMVTTAGTIRSSSPTWWTDGIDSATTETSNPVNIDWIWKPVIWSWSLCLQMISVVLGLVGNFLVILVLIQRRHTGSSADALIGNLAAADFLTSLFLIPLPRASQVPSTLLGSVYCKIIFTSVLVWFCILVSTLTLMAISVKPYVAIVYPFHFARLRKRKHINICITLLWGTSLVANLYIPLTIHVNGDSHECKVGFLSFASQIVIGVYSFVICFVIPILVMVVTNVIAARTLQRQSKRFKNANLKDGLSTASMNLLVAKKRVLYMLLLVVVIYCICWGPNSVAYFLYNMHVLDSSYLYGPIDRVLVLLAFYNSCANPIVYTLRYPQFRRALRKVFTCSKASKNALFEFNVSTSTVSTNKRDQKLSAI